MPVKRLCRLPGTACRFDRRSRSLQVRPAQKTSRAARAPGAPRNRPACTRGDMCRDDGKRCAGGAAASGEPVSTHECTDAELLAAVVRPQLRRLERQLSSARSGGRWSSSSCRRSVASVPRRAGPRPTRRSGTRELLRRSADTIASDGEGNERLINTSPSTCTRIREPIISLAPAAPRLDPYVRQNATSSTTRNRATRR